MCDKDHYESLNERVNKLERDQLITSTKQDEQIKTLFESVKVLRNVVYTFALIMLLTLVYGALGPTGFNAVTSRTPGTAFAQNTISENN